METKMQQKLEKRWLSLPLHHIDTSVLLEPASAAEGRACFRYLNRVGKLYRAKFSIPMLGEFLMAVLLLENRTEQYKLLEFIDLLTRKANIEPYAGRSVHTIEQHIREVEPRIEQTDCSILACAVEDGARSLVTLDRHMLYNKQLQKEFGILILHPQDFL